MGSSKKRKEKKEKKKHKKVRSRSRSHSREKDTHKRHKSSQREKKRSREIGDEKGYGKISKKRHHGEYEEEDFNIESLLEKKRIQDEYGDDYSGEKGSGKNRQRDASIEKYSPEAYEEFTESFSDTKLASKEYQIEKSITKKRIHEEYDDNFNEEEEGPLRKRIREGYDDNSSLESERFSQNYSESFQKPSDKSIENNFSKEQDQSDDEDDHDFALRLLETKQFDESYKDERKEKSVQRKSISYDAFLKKVKIKKEPPSEHSNQNQSERDYEEGEVEPQAGNSGKSDLSLSIEETNKLRAKLGLKPLEVPEIPGLGATEGEQEGEKVKEVFVKTENISEKKQAEKIKEKILTMKEKRKIANKLSKVKGLGESDSDDESAAAWVEKTRKLQEEKEKAEKRAKLLEEMDAEFGVGALIEEEFVKKKSSYTSSNLKGLTVGHSTEAFKEGQRIILTLKDKDVLDENDDILENVNLIDDEKYAKNVENKKKKPDYRPYEEPEFDEFGILKKKNLLEKYDEEIEGQKKKTFKLGDEAVIDKEKELELIRMKLRQQQGVTLEMSNVRLATEYYTTDEMVQFKKPKSKKRKVRKREILKADDLLAMPSEDSVQEIEQRDKSKTKSGEDNDEEEEFLYGNGTNEEGKDVEMNAEGTGSSEDLTGVTVDEDQAEIELHTALNKARKLKQRETLLTAPEKVMEVLKKTGGVKDNDPKLVASKGGTIVLNSTAEFCRTLGEIPTYGMSGNRDEEADELLDFERELMEERKKQEMEAQNRGAWNEVDIDEKPVEIMIRENEPILEEEPDVSLGVAGALTLATKKGYLDKDAKKLFSAPRPSQLQAQTYTIEEKFYEDDKFGKRDRYTGPIQDFREKDTYKPDVKLEYIDDSGRLLTAKEAFRYLSHKFHGKGPGKNKVDKRMKKVDQDTRLKQMSSTDTPLNTLKLLQEKQKEMQSPYIVLSGGSKTLTQTMISKSK